MQRQVTDDLHWYREILDGRAAKTIKIMTVKNPIVSICMPVYNTAEFLQQAIDSALAQTYTDLELLIVDNASTDTTYDIAMAAAQQDARVRVVRNDRDLGHNANFTKCFQLARGTWIKCLCGDDWLEPDCLERMMAFDRLGPQLMNGTERYILPPQMSAPIRELYQEYFRTHALLLTRRFPGQRVISADDFADLLAEDPTMNCLGAPSAMFQKAAFERVGGFNPALITLDDWEFFARIAQLTGVINVPEAISNYRIHEMSASKGLETKRPFKKDFIAPLIIRHDVVYSDAHSRVREAARRRGINLRYGLFDAMRRARNSVAPYTRDRRDVRAASDWKEFVERYPRALTVPPSYYPIKTWRVGWRVVRHVAALALGTADAG